MKNLHSPLLLIILFSLLTVILPSCGEEGAIEERLTIDTLLLNDTTLINDTILIDDTVVVISNTTVLIDEILKASPVPAAALENAFFDLGTLPYYSQDDAKLMDGYAPVYNDGYDLVVAYNPLFVYPKTAYSIACLSNTTNIEGMYLQLIDDDGNKIQDYFSNIVNRSPDRQNPILIYNSGTFAFNETITPGRFKVQTSLYDTQGEATKSEIVNMRMGTWGGNSPIIGKWKVTKMERIPNYQGTTTLTCTGGSEITLPFRKDTIGNRMIEFLADGTYAESYFKGGQSYNFDSVTLYCKEYYDLNPSESGTVTASGNWAYDEDGGFTMVNYNSLFDSELFPEFRNDTTELEIGTNIFLQAELSFEGDEGEIHSSWLDLRGENPTTVTWSLERDD